MNDAPEPRSALRSLLREPLIHFLTLAALLFGAQALFASDTRDVIRVDAATQGFLFEQQESLLLRPLTAAEKQEVVEDFIIDEILVREATKRGFTESSRVRTLLVQNMRFFIAGDIPEISDEDLRAWFEDNKTDFASPPSLDLDHVVFNDPAAVPADIMTRLSTADDLGEIGDFDLAFGPTMKFMSRERLAQAFGPDAALSILAIADDDTSWHGPIISRRGAAHFVRVADRYPPRIPEFDQARDWIDAQWLSAQMRAAMDEALDGMRPNYRVDIEPLEAGAANG